MLRPERQTAYQGKVIASMTDLLGTHRSRELPKHKLSSRVWGCFPQDKHQNWHSAGKPSPSQPEAPKLPAPSPGERQQRGYSSPKGSESHVLTLRKELSE